MIVRFSHPWTDRDTGTSYHVGQVAELSASKARLLIAAGIAIPDPDSTPTDPPPPTTQPHSHEVGHLQGTTALGQSLITAADAAAVRTLIDFAAQVQAVVAGVVDAAPGALDTLNELAAALGDDPNFAATMTTQLAAKANDNAVVKLTGAQTVAGVKTFSSAPVVPDGAFTQAKVSGLTTALNGKASTQALTDGLATKADATATTNALAGKADTTAVNTALAAKADTTTVNNALAAKADLVGGKVPAAQLPDITGTVTLADGTERNAAEALSSADPRVVHISTQDDSDLAAALAAAPASASIVLVPVAE